MAIILEVNEKPTKKLITAAISLAVIAGSIYGTFHVRDVLDWILLRNYTPSAQVIELANQTTMQDQTRHVFYVNRPKIQDKQQFKLSCSQAEQTIVLGCFIESSGIYLLNVDDKRLTGVVQVTAAHEVLHAQYERLGKKDKEHVDRMTSEFFASLQDVRLKKVIENYRRKDPSVVPNELHSILGTEVRDLSPDLEAYYGRYFKDRKAIVAYSEKYEQTFVDLEDQVANYDQQLKDLRTQIDANQARLKNSETAIDSEKKRLDDLLASGKTDEYNAGVPGFNNLVNQHNSIIQQTQSLIEHYNEIVEKRNSLATTEAQLVQAIDANSLPKAQ